MIPGAGRLIRRAALGLVFLLAGDAGSLGAAPPGTAGSARPGGSWDDPIELPRDLTGRSVKTPRVRARHSPDPDLAGGSAYLLRRDPWLGYQRGRELALREFARADGVFGEAGKQRGPRLEDGVSHMAAGGHVAACGTCHNTPWRDMGSGPVIAKNGGRGRDTPHLFGAGLLEMLGWQGRRQLLALADRDASGWISLAEAAGREAWLDPGPAGHGMRPRRIPFGRFDDVDGDGRPDLDPVLAVWYVDSRGARIPWARRLSDPGVAGYSFEFQVFGAGHHPRQSEHGPPTPSTLRAFSATAFDTHAGLQAHDPTLLEDPDEDGLAAVSLAGAPQFVSAAPRDRGRTRTSGGVSRDDPDRDGVLEEISQGDLDLIEWYLLNHPRPAERMQSASARHGRALFASTGCIRCHVPDWQIEGQGPGRPHAGDRRFFDLEVAPDASGALRGRLISLASTQAGTRSPRRAGFLVKGLYSDLATHDLGPGFRELQFDGSVVTRHRTAPLWGVGSTAPYGHDGASLDLDAVIRRHGGEAEASTRRYQELGPLGREALLAFLRGLVLYQTEDLPTDLDGDGEVAASFEVAGQDTGLERFNPEWLFAVPGRIEGWVTGPDGSEVRSEALTNRDAAYGLDLPALRDKDGDGFPDLPVATPAPRGGGSRTPQDP